VAPATKRPLISEDLKKQIIHIAAFTATAVLISIVNGTGQPNEEYQLVRISQPPVEAPAQPTEAKKDGEVKQPNAPVSY